MSRGTYIHKTNAFGSPRDRIQVTAHQTSVGFTLFHTIGDREKAVDQIDSEFSSVYQDMLRAMGVDDVDAFDPLLIVKDPVHASARAAAARAKMEASSIYPFWQSGVSPIFAEWDKFRAGQGGAKEYLWLTNWDDYERWFGRLEQLRKAIKDHDIVLNRPDPKPLEKNLLADIGDQIKNALGDIETFAKYALYGGLGLVAIVVLSSVVSNMRSGKDPADKYAQFARYRKNEALA